MTVIGTQRPVNAQFNADGWAEGALCSSNVGRTSNGVSPASSEGSDAAASSVVNCELGPGLHWVRAAREFAAEALAAWDVSRSADDVILAVSELVANALRHPGGCDEGWPTATLWLSYRPPYVLCQVVDSDLRNLPIVEHDESDWTAQTGRGLHLVEALSLRWGWQPDEDGGKIVWALFAEQ